MQSSDALATVSAPPHSPKHDAGAGTQQFLTFRVRDGEYGVDIMRVREIRGWTEATRMPHSAEYIRGVINLRGVVIPIFDLRCRFGQGNTEATEKHVVIVMAIGQRTVGVLVDAVSDILSVAGSEIKEAPNSGEATIDEAYISGLISAEDKMVVLLDVEHLFDSHMLKEADSSSKTTSNKN